MFASINGYLKVVKYLVEVCHATITDEAISRARKDDIRRYLQSKYQFTQSDTLCFSNLQNAIFDLI
jgi:hypothetical protein